MKVKATKRALELRLSPSDVKAFAELLSAVARTDWTNPKTTNLARYLMGVVEGFTDDPADFVDPEDSETAVYRQGVEDGDPYRKERERGAELNARARVHGLGAPEGGA